jgi:hypothetical protein
MLGFALLLLISANRGNAAGTGDLKEYFSNTACQVKAVEKPSEKRLILEKSLSAMSKALDMVRDSPQMTKEDLAGIDRFQTALQEKRDELAGWNGFERVSDAQLNAFSDYVVQDMEQAQQTVTISLVTLLLIIIIILLLV